MVKQQSIETVEDGIESENWMEKLFENFKIISDVMKVKFEQKCNLVNSKQERIFELENVLKNSVAIASEQEKEYFNMVKIKKDLDIKVRTTFVLFFFLLVIKRTGNLSEEFAFSRKHLLILEEPIS